MDKDSSVQGNDQVWLKRCRWLIIVTCLLLWLLRLMAPSDLCDDDKQLRQASYGLDVTVNGHWVFQENHIHQLAGKPPLYTWLNVFVAKLFCAGEINRFSLTFPGTVAVFLVAFVLLEWGRRRFGLRVAVLASLFWLLTPAGCKMMLLGRIDAVFTALILVSSVAGIEARRGTCSWLWFWVASLAATMAKGPLGLLLAALPVLGFILLSRTQEKGRSQAVKENLLGLGLYLSVGLSWFFAAWNGWGQAFIDRVIMGEFIGHSIGAMDHEDSQGRSLSHWFSPLAFLVSRCLPWSLPAFASIWYLWRMRGQASESSRALIQAFGISLVLSIGIFTLAHHRRPDLLFPLAPSLALIAAWAVAEGFKTRLEWAGHFRFATLASLVFMVVLGSQQFSRSLSDKDMIRTRAFRQQHQSLVRLYPEMMPPLAFTQNTGFGLQLFLQSHQQHITPDEAAAFLQVDGRHLAVVQKADQQAFLQACAQRKIAVTCVVPWPENAGKHRDMEVRIYATGVAPR